MNKKVISILLLSLPVGLLIMNYGCRVTRIPGEYPVDTLYTNVNGNGDLLKIEFKRGPGHNHPLMAVWTEDTAGNYLQTLYVAESIAKGVFGYGDKSSGKWMPGPIRRPAALPVWSHSRGIKETDGLYVPTQETAIPDAYTGATPPSSFILFARTDIPLPDMFYVYFEINQTWDWNNYWTNNKFPGDEEYKTSCQPALVYRAPMSCNNDQRTEELELTGNSHYNGENGEIYDDLNTITTAKNITKSIIVSCIK